jgi:hypothetical protein
MLARVGPSAQRVDRAGVVVELLAGGVVVERFAELVVSWAGVVLPMSASSTPGGNALQPRLVAAAAALGAPRRPHLDCARARRRLGRARARRRRDCARARRRARARRHRRRGRLQVESRAKHLTRCRRTRGGLGCARRQPPARDVGTDRLVNRARRGTGGPPGGSATFGARAARRAGSLSPPGAPSTRPNCRGHRTSSGRYRSISTTMSHARPVRSPQPACPRASSTSMKCRTVFFPRYRWLPDAIARAARARSAMQIRSDTSCAQTCTTGRFRTSSRRRASRSTTPSCCHGDTPITVRRRPSTRTTTQLFPTRPSSSAACPRSMTPRTRPLPSGRNPRTSPSHTAPAASTFAAQANCGPQPRSRCFSSKNSTVSSRVPTASSVIFS